MEFIPYPSGILLRLHGKQGSKRRAHKEPNLLPAELAMGISSLLPQNILIPEHIPGWCSRDEAAHPSGEGWERKREVWSIIQPKTSHSEPGRTRHNPQALPSPSPLLLGVHPWRIPKSHSLRDFPMEELNEDRWNQGEH